MPSLPIWGYSDYPYPIARAYLDTDLLSNAPRPQRPAIAFKLENHCLTLAHVSYVHHDRQRERQEQ